MKKNITLLLVFFSFCVYNIQAQTDTSRWIVIGKKTVPVKPIIVAPVYTINVSTKFKQPGKTVVKKIATTPTISIADEWAAYWNPRVNIEKYTGMITPEGGFLLMLNDAQALYPVAAASGNSFLLAEIKRKTDLLSGLVNVLRWTYNPTNKGTFAIGNSIAGYLQVVPVKGGISYNVTLSKTNSGTAEEFKWIVVPSSESYWPTGVDLSEIYMAGKLYKLVLYHPATKKIIAFNKEAGKTGLVAGSFEDYLALRLPPTWDADWDFVNIETGTRSLPGRFATKMMAPAQWDLDGDGHFSSECGGFDCDDENAGRFPGNPEVCDAEGLDEDCNPTTYGTKDTDGDGFIDAFCANGPVTGTDCDDNNPAVNSNSGFYLFINDSTISSAACNGFTYRLPKDQIALALPNGTAHISLRISPPMIIPKQ